MMKVGVLLVQSFDIVVDGFENKGFQELVMSICNDILFGISFVGVLCKYFKYFDDFYCNLVDFGEKVGVFE